MTVIEALELEPSAVFPPRVANKKTIDIIRESELQARFRQARHAGKDVDYHEFMREGGFPQPDRSDSMIRLPMFDEVRASAGPGVVPTSERAESVVSFDRQFLRDRGAVPERCSVIETRGDSMQPTIPDGSLLIVDHSQTEVSGGAIFVIGVSDTVLVKRVRLRFDGSVELASDNTAYAPEIINRDQLADLRVIGKVVYYCRTP